jgi:hypothetical protein
MNPLGAFFEKIGSEKPYSRWLQWLAWLILASAIALPRLAGLSRLVTPDEHFSDYVVIYIAERQRGMSSAILDYVADLKPDYTVRINGLDYVQIYKIHP